MLLGKLKGRQVHFYPMDGCEFYVIRGSLYAAALRRDEKSTAVAVLVPPGMSYKQGGHACRRRAEKEGVCPR